MCKHFLVEVQLKTFFVAWYYFKLWILRSMTGYLKGGNIPTLHLGYCNNLKIGFLALLSLGSQQKDDMAVSMGLFWGRREAADATGGFGICPCDHRLLRDAPTGSSIWSLWSRTETT